MQSDIQLDANTNINMANGSSAVIGGGTNVSVTGVTTGREGTFTAPKGVAQVGRARILANGNSANVFNIDNKTNVTLNGFDIVGIAATTQRGVVVNNNSHNYRIEDINLTSFVNQAIDVNLSNNGIIRNVTAKLAGSVNNSVIQITKSNNQTLDNLTIDGLRPVANSAGLYLLQVDTATISNLVITDDNGDGLAALYIQASPNVTINNATITRAGTYGVIVSGKNVANDKVNVTLNNVTITAAPNMMTGLRIVGGASEVNLNNVNVVGPGI